MRCPKCNGRGEIQVDQVELGTMLTHRKSRRPCIVVWKSYREFVAQDLLDRSNMYAGRVAEPWERFRPYARVRRKARRPKLDPELVGVLGLIAALWRLRDECLSGRWPHGHRRLQANATGKRRQAK